MALNKTLIFVSLAILTIPAFGQSQSGSTDLWHGKERNIHDRPDGGDFFLVNGTKRLTRPSMAPIPASE